MKKVVKIVLGFIGFVYFAIAIFAIACLLKKNEFGYPQFGDKTLFVSEEDSTEAGFKKGELVVLTKPKNEDVKNGDVVLFYDTEFAKNTIMMGTITNSEVINEKETTFSITGKSFSSQYLVGKANDSTRYSKIGSVLNVLISRWGFFVIIIVPFFVLFMIELFAIYTEIKYGKKNNN